MNHLTDTELEIPKDISVDSLTFLEPICTDSNSVINSSRQSAVENIKGDSADLGLMPVIKFYGCHKRKPTQPYSLSTEKRCK
jgi:hypothetical protein